MSSIRTLPEALAAAADGDAGYIFVGPDKETHRSYADVHQASIGVACALRALGLRRGDLVALVIGDSDQFLTTLFGASIAGVIPASLYPPATTSDLPRYLAATARILNSCGARAVVTTAGLHPHVDTLRSICPTLAFVVPCDALDAPVSGSGAPVSADDIAFVQFTSGRRSPRSRRNSGPPASARRALSPATASPSTCSPRPFLPAVGTFASNTSRQTT
jgi:acyl-CoA synthetase (AMP-forming)/AMP-acid ligase II